MHQSVEITIPFIVAFINIPVTLKICKLHNKCVSVKKITINARLKIQKYGYLLSQLTKISVQKILTGYKIVFRLFYKGMIQFS